MSRQHNGITRHVHLSSSLHFDSLGDFVQAGEGAPKLAGQTARGLDNGYGLQGNPTCHALQDAVSQLENGSRSLLYSSGMTALTALGGLLRSGDHWLLPAGVYGPMQRYARYLKERYDISYDMYDPLDPQSLQRLITPHSKLIHIESPCSVTFETTPIAGVVAIARGHSLLVSADNTWASGVLCKPLDTGVDISILSLTKYAAGYSDVFMGSVTTRDEQLYKQLAYDHRVHGYTVSPFSAMLVQRGLETLPTRIIAHARSAARLLRIVRKSPAVARIFCGGPSATTELKGSNGLFAVELYRVYSNEELQDILSGLRVFSIGESWGGTKSLVLPFQPQDLADHASSPQGTVLRFHAGLEDVAAQAADIKNILHKLD
ncbi:MAG TPA: PLP-dependent aspartate aminotransferase family protein [Verrucomicrobiae bacterium]|nr:PLP-dependent aspartate aminotransferase family protein [Verrucomicrobiae bacterium]